MNELLSVVTIAEAARMWRKNRRTVMRAIDSRRRGLVARQSGDIWLVTVESCRRRWGAPIEPLDTETLAYPT